jgi:hypothetical protein
MELTTLDPKNLTIFANDRDILRDLFTYLNYVGERNVKRMTRSNEIPRADLNRLAKLLGGLDFEPGENEIDAVQRIDFIDTLALRLQLVSYDLKGEYRGYTSSEPSFIENHIVVNATNFQKFLALAPAAQEKRILETLIHTKLQREYDNYSNNEFYQVSVVGELDSFYEWGSATGAMPTLKFPEIRLFLLEVLKNCPAGQWISTESLIAYLKANHPYFLIPQKLPISKNKWDTITSRYSNFHEGTERWQHNEKPIPDDAPDAFERVEGRYVERFLEYIPLVMRFVEVAYDPNPYKGPLPKRNVLKAFRVNERFLCLMSGETGLPKVTIQPNFDVVVEADFYPAKVIRQVAALGEQVSSPNSGHGAYVGIFLLKKAAVAAAQVKDPNLNVIQLLKNLSGRDLPPNVQIELDEWAGHADQFTLYEGFALLETAELPLEAEKFIAERISPALHLVRSPEKVFSTLETLGQVPVRIQHPTGEITPVAESAQSLFPKEAARVNAQKTAKPVKVAKVITVSYQFPEAESFASIKKALAELRCPFQSDPVTRTVSLQQKEQAKFDEAIEKLASEFVFEIE